MILRALLILLLTASPVWAQQFGPYNWLPTVTLVPEKDAPIGIFINTLLNGDPARNIPAIPFPAKTYTDSTKSVILNPNWTTVDLGPGPHWMVYRGGGLINGDPNVPVEAVSIDIAGLLVITNATSVWGPQFNCSVNMAFRPVGSTMGADSYQMQTVAVPAAQGTRSNAYTRVRLIDRKFQVSWHYDPECYPPNSGSAINLQIVGIQVPFTAGGTSTPPAEPTGPPIPTSGRVIWFCEPAPLGCREWLIPS